MSEQTPVDKVKQILGAIDHYEKQIPPNEETVAKLQKWFTEYNLRCVCVPYTSDFIETTKKLAEIEKGYFSFLLPDQLGLTTRSFVEGTYEQLESIGLMEYYDEVELILPIELIKRWKLRELEDIILTCACLPKPVKLLFQTPLIAYGYDIKMVTHLCVMNDIPFVKTGTGYWGPAFPKHVSWMRNAIDMAHIAKGKETTQLKVAGGIGSYDRLNEAFGLGADLIGTSKTDEIIEEILARG